MVGKVCLFTKCHGPSKWNHSGIAIKEAVTYSELLGQKREFQQFIEFNDNQISKFGKMDSYCIVDKLHSPSKGSNIDIFIFNEEHCGTLYLEYSVHKQYVSKNCNDLITFLNFNKNSTFYLHNSFIYVKSTGKFKWAMFFGVLEFLIKNLNTSIIGSQFYFPLLSGYLIMNEIRLLLNLPSWWQSVKPNFSKASVKSAFEISTLGFKKVVPSEAALKNPKNVSLMYEQMVKKIKILPTKTCKSIQRLQLKRKSLDLYLGDDCLPKTKRFNSEKNLCHCNNYMWKIFASFEKHSILNYSSILEAKKCFDPEAMDVFSIDSVFQNDCRQYSNSATLHQNQHRLNQNLYVALITSEKSVPAELLDKVSEIKNTTGSCLEKIEEKCSKYGHTSDFHSLKKIKSVSNSKGCLTLERNYNSSLSALEYKNEETYSKATTTEESQKNIAGTYRQMLPNAGFVVPFQTASGKSLKISEAALQLPERIFEDISFENLDIFSQKKTPKDVQLKSFVNNKHSLGFQTASGKSLHASKVAIEAAEKMFKEISVEQIDVFPEKQTEITQNSKKCYPNLEECVDEDINVVLAENFFEDIPFDEKEIDCKQIEDSGTSSIQKPEISQTTCTPKMRKSLGGRRSLKPYTLKK